MKLTELISMAEPVQGGSMSEVTYGNFKATFPTDSMGIMLKRARQCQNLCKYHTSRNSYTANILQISLKLLYDNRDKLLDIAPLIKEYNAVADKKKEVLKRSGIPEWHLDHNWRIGRSYADRYSVEVLEQIKQLGDATKSLIKDYKKLSLINSHPDKSYGNPLYALRAMSSVIDSCPKAWFQSPADQKKNRNNYENLSNRHRDIQSGRLGQIRSLSLCRASGF